MSTERLKRTWRFALLGASSLLVLGAFLWFISPPPWAQAAPTDTGIASSPPPPPPQSSPQPLDLGKNTFYVQPRLLALLDKHSRGEEVATTLEVQFSADPVLVSTEQESATLAADIAARGGTAVTDATDRRRMLHVTAYRTCGSVVLE